jgi:fatty-acyl-CoA synthase
MTAPAPVAPPVIASIDDVRRIEAGPYGAFLPHARVLDALEASAARHGARVALRAIDSPDPAAPTRTWTYAALLGEIRRAARLFRHLAGGEVPRVALLLPPIPEAHVALWGAEAAGIACPINFQLNAEHVDALVAACGAQVAVVLGPASDLDVWSRAEGLRAACPALRHVLAVPADRPLPDGGVDDWHAALAAHGDGPLEFPAATPLAALFHTGGTTGAPKFVQHTQANQLHSAWGAACLFGTTERDVMLNGFPLFHVAGAFVYGLSTLLAGAELVLPTRLGLRHAALVARYREHVAKHGATLLAAVPTVMATLMGQSLGVGDLAPARALLTGGSPLPDELAAAFERRHGVPVRNILGMTETAGVIAIEPTAGPRTPGACGLPLPFTQVEVRGRDGRPVPTGASGILFVRGPNVSPGYTDPARNAGTFEADGWLASGDLAHLDAEGRVFVTGRSKDVIIRGSHNIDPGLIENVLLAHPAVQMAAAVGEPDAYAGELPVAFVSLKPGATATPEELATFAAPQIAERPAVPKRIAILDALPTTAVGKVYKPVLRALATRRVLAAGLAARGLDGRVGVEVTETAGGFATRFTLADEADLGAVRELMQPYALAWTHAVGAADGSAA